MHTEHAIIVFDYRQREDARDLINYFRAAHLPMCEWVEAGKRWKADGLQGAYTYLDSLDSDEEEEDA